MPKGRSLAVIYFIFIFLCIAPLRIIDAGKGIYMGEAAPVFSLADLNNKEINLKSFLSRKVVLISFWTVNCSSCVKEFSELKILHKDFSKKGLEILSIDVRDSRKKVVKLIKEKEVNYSVLLDADGEVAGLYGVKGVPFNVVIDKKGIVRYQWYELPADFRKNIEALLQ